MRRISLCTALLLVCLSYSVRDLSAQSSTVIGRVSSAQDGRPLESVTVEAVDRNLRALTDRHGRYVLTGLHTGSVTIRFSVLGHATFTRTVTVGSGGRGHLDVTLESVPIALSPLRVLAERTRMTGAPGGLDVVPGSAQLLTREALQAPEFIFDNVHDQLRLIPGVNVQDEDGYGLRPNIGLRGTGVERSSKITLMEDGVLIAPAPYAAPSAYYFPVAGRMEAIEVRKGSSQIRYGPRTIGGAVNLVSSSIPERRSWSLDLGGGEDGTRKGRAGIGDSGTNYGWLVETYQIDTEGFKQLASGDDTGFRIQDYLAKLRVNSAVDGQGPYQELELKVGYTDEVSNETYLGLTDADFGTRPLLRYPASAEDVMDAEHSQVQLRHFVDLGGFDITTTAYRNDFSRNWYKLQSVLGSGIGGVLSSPASNLDALGVLGGSDSGDDALKVRANNREYYGRGVQTLVGLRFSAGSAEHRLEVGARFHQDEEDRLQWEDGFRMEAGEMVLTSEGAPGSQSNRVTTADAWSFYAQDEIDFGSLTLSPGLRVETIDFTRNDYAGEDPGRVAPTRIRTNSVTSWLPGLGFSVEAGRGTFVFGGVHKGFGPPGPGASDEVEPEASVNYELGVRVRRSGIAAQAAGFFSDYSNILGRSTLANAEDGTGESFNGGDVNTFGAELSADYDPAWGTDLPFRIPLRASYTYTHAEFRSAFESDFDPWGTVAVGDRLPYLPLHQFSASAGVQTTGWSLSISSVAASAMRTVAGQGSIAAGEGTDSYLLFNVAGELDLPRGGTLYLGIQNLTDKRYSVARRPAGLRPGLPRTVIAGVRISR